MAIKTKKEYYDTLANNNVQFLQGTQASLNTLLPGGTNAGNAKEGAFYLTTDTHRLYIGRKVPTNATNLPTGVTAGKTYPEEVSTGISVVADAGSLPSGTTGDNQVGPEAHDGDLYYIQNTNILAAYYNGSWVQVNPATGITSFAQSTSEASGHSDTVLINSSIVAQNGTKSSSVGLVKGNNITLTKGQKTIGSATVSTIKIDAVDTTYKAGTAATTAGSSNGAKIGLKKNSGTSLDSQVTITGANDIGVTSTDNGAVTVTGPNFTGKGVTANAVANGFKFQLKYTAGDGSGDKTCESSNSTIDPTITYGSSSGYTETTTEPQSPSAVHFSNGNATLNIYSKAQTDYAITTAINNKLAAANAMTYKGTVKNSAASSVTATTTIETITASTTNHIGDTYKAACDFTYNGQKVKTGDLIILQGTEANGAITTSSLQIDIVPSGDEPFIGPSFSGDSNGQYDTTNGINSDSTSRTILNLTDLKGSSGNVVAGVTIPNTEKIKVTSSITNDKNATLNIEHRTLTTTRTDNNNLSSGSGNDTIGDNAVSFFVLNSKDSISTDSYGHVDAISGKQVTFKHNKLTNMAVGYTNDTVSGTLLSKAHAQIQVQDNYATKSGSIYLESETLSIETNASSNPTGLRIDMKWGSF